MNNSERKQELLESGLVDSIKSLFQNSPMATIFTAIGFIILMIKKLMQY